MKLLNRNGSPRGRRSLCYTFCLERWRKATQGFWFRSGNCRTTIISCIKLTQVSIAFSCHAIRSVIFRSCIFSQPRDRSFTCERIDNTECYCEAWPNTRVAVWRTSGELLTGLLQSKHARVGTDNTAQVFSDWQTLSCQHSRSTVDSKKLPHSFRAARNFPSSCIRTFSLSWLIG